MIVGHFSDLHGNLKEFLTGTETPDLWVCTGDFFPNDSRGNIEIEVPYQTEWLYQPVSNSTLLDTIIERLSNKPLLWIAGNHDYINLGEELRKKGYPAYDITTDGVEVLGIKFAGFREINYIYGEWAGETHDFHDIVEATIASNPDILVTHAPPADILDKHPSVPLGYGITTLATALAWSEHKIKAHFFGHVHAGFGTTEEMNIKFINGSNHVRFHLV